LPADLKNRPLGLLKKSFLPAKHAKKAQSSYKMKILKEVVSKALCVLSENLCVPWWLVLNQYHKGSQRKAQSRTKEKQSINYL